MTEVRAVTIPMSPRTLFSLADCSGPHRFFRLREREPSRSSTLMGPAGIVKTLSGELDISVPFSGSPNLPLRGPRGILFVPVMPPLFLHAMVQEVVVMEVDNSRSYDFISTSIYLLCAVPFKTFFRTPPNL